MGGSEEEEEKRRSEIDKATTILPSPHSFLTRTRGGNRKWQQMLKIKNKMKWRREKEGSRNWKVKINSISKKWPLANRREKMAKCLLLLSMH
jgi:hypothetical protein